LWFGVAFVALLVACWLTPTYDTSGKATVDVWEKASYYLTRIVFSLFCAASLLLLLVPAARRVLRGVKDRSVWWAPVAVLANVAIEKAGKSFLHLPRPNDDGNGFPSGHAMASFLVAWLVATKYPKLAPLWYAIAAAVAWSRIQVHAHYPYQVVGGALIGTLIGWSISHFLKDKATRSAIPTSEAAVGV
jgi:membrane-associated phospholipid phosphatase